MRERQRDEPVDGLGVSRDRDPRRHLGRGQSLLPQLALPLPRIHATRSPRLSQAVERLLRPGAADDVAADDDRRVGRDLRQHRSSAGRLPWTS